MKHNYASILGMKRQLHFHRPQLSSGSGKGLLVPLFQEIHCGVPSSAPPGLALCRARDIRESRVTAGLSLQCIDREARAANFSSSLSLPDKTLQFVKDHPLMDDSVTPTGNRPRLVKSGVNYTQIVVDRTQALDGTVYDVMFVSTGGSRAVVTSWLRPTALCPVEQPLPGALGTVHPEKSPTVASDPGPQTTWGTGEKRRPWPRPGSSGRVSLGWWPGSRRRAGSSTSSRPS